MVTGIFLLLFQGCGLSFVLVFFPQRKHWIDLHAKMLIFQVNSSNRLQYLYSVVVHLYPNLRVLFASIKCDPLSYFSLTLLSILTLWCLGWLLFIVMYWNWLGRKKLNATSWCMSTIWCILAQSILICNVVLPFLNTRLQILDNPRFLEKLLLWKHYVVLPCILLLRF